jgi:hypothetical protein
MGGGQRTLPTYPFTSITGPAYGNRLEYCSRHSYLPGKSILPHNILLKIMLTQLPPLIIIAQLNNVPYQKKTAF